MLEKQNWLKWIIIVIAVVAG